MVAGLQYFYFIVLLVMHIMLMPAPASRQIVAGIQLFVLLF